MRASRIKTVVRQVDPRIERYKRALSVAVVMAAGIMGFALGGVYKQTTPVVLKDEDESLLVQLTHLQTRADVDRRTIAQLRLDLAESSARLSERERQLSFYKDVMAPEEHNAPLVMREPALFKVQAEGAWRYQLVVQQGSRSNTVKFGDLGVHIEGTQNEEVRSIPLAELDPGLGAGKLRMNFRYFQRWEGALTLPTGFSPTGIVMTAILSKPRKAQVERRFPWRDHQLSGSPPE